MIISPANSNSCKIKKTKTSRGKFNPTPITNGDVRRQVIITQIKKNSSQSESESKGRRIQSKKSTEVKKRDKMASLNSIRRWLGAAPEKNVGGKKHVATMRRSPVIHNGQTLRPPPTIAEFSITNDLPWFGFSYSSQ